MIFNLGGDNCSILASTNYLISGNIVSIVVSDTERLTPCGAHIVGPVSERLGAEGFITGMAGLVPGAHKLILASLSTSCNDAIMILKEGGAPKEHHV